MKSRITPRPPTYGQLRARRRAGCPARSRAWRRARRRRRRRRSGAASAPAATRSSYRPRTDSWPAHSTTWSTSSTRGSPSTVRCRPSSSTRSYVAPLTCSTPDCLSTARCAQPDVLPSADADRRGLALDQGHLARPASAACGSVSPPGWTAGSPTPQCAIQSSRSVGRVVGEEVADVDADPAGADHGHPPAGDHPAAEHVGVRHDLGVVDARDVGDPRLDAGGDHHLVVRREVGGGRPRCRAARRRRAPRAGGCSSAASRGSPPCRAPASPAGTGRRSTRTARTASPRTRARRPRPPRRARPGRRRRRRPSAAARGSAAAAAPASVSRQARGLTRQEAVLFSKTWSRQAWLQAMQVLISSARPAAALATKSGSASSGRAIETRSASPAARIDSASSGVLIRLDAHTGTDTSAFSRAVADRQAPRGTWVMIVGTRASCQPMPVLKAVTPASSQQVRELDDLVPGLAALDQVEQRDPVDDREVRRRPARGPGGRPRPGTASGCAPSRPTRRCGRWCGRRGTG